MIDNFSAFTAIFLIALVTFGTRVIGMEIIRDMEKDGTEWDDGTICDPKNGKIYDCSLWVDEDNPDLLQVRGYVLFFFRTQTWERVK